MESKQHVTRPFWTSTCGGGCANLHSVSVRVHLLRVNSRHTSNVSHLESFTFGLNTVCAARTGLTIGTADDAISVPGSGACVKGLDSIPTPNDILNYFCPVVHSRRCNKNAAGCFAASLSQFRPQYMYIIGNAIPFGCLAKANWIIIQVVLRLNSSVDRDIQALAVVLTQCARAVGCHSFVYRRIALNTWLAFCKNGS